MAEASTLASEGTETITVAENPAVPAQSNQPTLTLRLKKPRTSREVHWAEDTVDNEGLNKKSSKCCCIYTKPKTFEERESSSSESDDDCEHCRGHVEKKKKRLKPSDEGDDVSSPHSPNAGHPVPAES
ncbi:E3 ubiquitin-protein ligase PPP1R11-like [Paramacrobiotus metropolitanus]|uniref:E3 ubiquitin-protein ligase PPP1R11-like n=1 Tax=Paramacrobiotus metropolitanus TaxID=2943436 RepID=UPI002445FCD5|nr:E3 ubiquitin-protein ligase PPP1R11-like [Paramacrobiotus metropolitanus]